MDAPISTGGRTASGGYAPGRMPPRPKPRRALRIWEVFFWIVGFGCLGWVAWTVLDAALYQHLQQARLEEATSKALAVTSSAAEQPIMDSPALAALESATVPRVPVAEGTALATLEIPRIDLEAVVAAGVTEKVLRRAIGHLPSSAPPGSADGNVALAAHRDSFFRSLVDVREGDELTLRGPGFDHRFLVEWTRIVEPEDVDVVAATDHAAITLVTCYPPAWVGPAPQRWIVRGRRLDEP